MPKEKSICVCDECGGTNPKWLGKCPHCGAWNSLEETVGEPSGGKQHRFQSLAKSALVTMLAEIDAVDVARTPTGQEELDRVLGGEGRCEEGSCQERLLRKKGTTMTLRWRRALRYLWAAPATLAGLVLAALACAMGASARVTDGVIEVADGCLGRWVDAMPARFKFVAITFGHVVIGQSHAVLRELRPHEHEHVRQYERWGVLFFAAYLGSSGVQWLCGRDAYGHNRFERQACAAQHAATVTLRGPRPLGDSAKV